MLSLVELKQLITDGGMTVILEKLFRLLMMQPRARSAAANEGTAEVTINIVGLDYDQGRYILGKQHLSCLNGRQQITD
jgi:plastocyanin domain-containing protein